jgi:septal ring factor EnvC (AmiA/AmiB activator)
MLLTILERDTQAGLPIRVSPIRPRPEAADETALLQDQRKQLTAKLERLRTAYLSGVEALADYAAAKSALEARAAALDAQIRALPASQDTGLAEAIVKARVSHCVQVLRDPAFSMSQKHAAAHQAIARCTFSKAENSLRVFYRLLS